jgi:hypothetical protein
MQQAWSVLWSGPATWPALCFWAQELWLTTMPICHPLLSALAQVNVFCQRLTADLRCFRRRAFLWNEKPITERQKK